MDWLWGVAGKSLFDPYSAHHAVWFFAITVACAATVRRHVWLWALATAVVWEMFEGWVVKHLPGFPFAGAEAWTNWLVGDSLSGLLGFAAGLAAARALRRQGAEDEQRSDMP